MQEHMLDATAFNGLIFDTNMHDDVNKTATINALPSLIEKLISQGYHFEALKEDSYLIKHIK